MILAALLLAAAVAAADTPMTDDEVVRRLSAGESMDAVLADVQRRPPAFDVSEDMLAELRSAGVPEALLNAMIARAAAAPPKEEPPAPPAAPAPMTELRLTATKLVVAVSRRLDPQLIAELELPAGALEADALALAVFCTTHGHDDPGVLRWPEGRVPKGFADGRLLAFFPATEGSGSGSKLRVALPDPMVIPLSAGVSHDLVVAALLRAGSTWVVLSRDQLNGVRAAAGSFTAADVQVEKVNGFPRLTVRRPVDASLPELPRGKGWAKDGWFHAEADAKKGVALSPDGRKSVVVAGDGVSLEIEGEPSEDLGFVSGTASDVEVLWSPDSRLVAITFIPPGLRGPSVLLWRIEPDDAVHEVKLVAVPAGAAVTFVGEGSRLLLVSREGGHLTGLLVNTADGTIASRSTELEVRSRWRDRLGPRLR